MSDRQTAHDLADEQISRYLTALKHNPKAHPGVCRDMIDKWLEYRHNHAPGEPRAML